MIQVANSIYLQTQCQHMNHLFFIEFPSSNLHYTFGVAQYCCQICYYNCSKFNHKMHAHWWLLLMKWAYLSYVAQPSSSHLTMSRFQTVPNVISNCWISLSKHIMLIEQLDPCLTAWIMFTDKLLFTIPRKHSHRRDQYLNLSERVRRLVNFTRVLFEASCAT